MLLNNFKLTKAEHSEAIGNVDLFLKWGFANE